MVESAYKQKTLSQITPFWAEAIAEAKIVIGGEPRNKHAIAKIGNQEHDLAEPACCIVGEAHGWSYSYRYDCSNCVTFSDALFFAYIQEPHTSNPRCLSFERLLTEFVQHWNENHG